MADAAFALVYELGIGNFVVERFGAEDVGRHRASKLWCCWCLFSVHSKPSGGAKVTEVATGGVGLNITRAGIRKHALEALDPLAAGVRFRNRPDRPVGASDIDSRAQVTFGIVYPSGLGIPSTYICFNRGKPVEQIVSGACSYAGLILEKGRLPGNPERINLFTLDGDLVRLDLEVEAHLGSTLHPGKILLLEKGNRVVPDRLHAVMSVLQEAQR